MNLSFFPADKGDCLLVTGADGHDPWEHWGLTENGNNVPDPVDHSLTITGSWLEVLSVAGETGVGPVGAGEGAAGCGSGTGGAPCPVSGACSGNT